jgi:hypothetical protein
MNRLTRRCSQPLFGVARPCRSWLVYFQLLRTLAPRAVAELVLVRSMSRASRLKLASAERRIPVIPPWLLVAALVCATAVCWWLRIIVDAIVFGIFAAVSVGALVAARFERCRLREQACKLPRDATCTYARSFDFRHTDTLVMRAVYEELQPFVGFPVQAAHRLSEDLRIDDEDLDVDVVPVIAQRLRRTLRHSEKNPYYGRIRTVEDLVHFMEAQPIEETQKT